MYGTQSRPTTSYFCYEILIFVTALLLVVSGCGRSGDSGGNASGANNFGDASYSGSTSVPGAIGANGDSSLTGDGTDLMNSLPGAAHAMSDLGNGTGITSLAGLQNALADISTMLKLMPQMVDAAQGDP